MRWLCTLAFVLATLGAAFAQTDAPTDPKCEVAPQLAPQPEGTPRLRDPQTTGRAGENLSEQLSRSEGVICPPPNVDPEIQLPTPDGSRMRVIPPPGSPGGDPTVRPK